MRRPFLLLALGIVSALSLSAAVPEPLDEAFQKLARDNGSWAYTEVSVSVDSNGKKSAETIIAFDPSKPFPEQYTPVSISGKPPTENQRGYYRWLGEERERRLERQVNSARDELLRLNVSGRWIVVDLEHATATQETDTTLFYDVPLLPDDTSPNALPADKFRLQARVHKADRVFEQAELSLREPLKIGKLTKLRALSQVFGFARVTEEFSPALATLHSETTGAVLFFGRRQVRDLTRRDFRHVTPYHSRFDVKIGPMRSIDF